MNGFPHVCLPDGHVCASLQRLHRASVVAPCMGCGRIATWIMTSAGRIVALAEKRDKRA